RESWRVRARGRRPSRLERLRWSEDRINAGIRGTNGLSLDRTQLHNVRYAPVAVACKTIICERDSVGRRGHRHPGQKVCKKSSVWVELIRGPAVPILHAMDIRSTWCGAICLLLPHQSSRVIRDRSITVIHEPARELDTLVIENPAFGG